MKKHLLLALTTLIVLSSCAKDKKDAVITIKTSYGDMKVILFEETPKHKANFIKLAEEGQYDSTTFHRIIKEFMIQGGDVDAKNGTRSTKTIPAEIVEGFYHEKGALAAARQGDRVNPEKASSWCQFYLVHGKTFSEAELTVDQRELNQAIGQLMRYASHEDIKDEFAALQEKEDYEAMNQLALEYVDLAEKELNIKLKKSISAERLKLYTEVGGAPHLDGEYTVFGKVVEGLDIVDKIAEVETARGDKPIDAIYISMEVERIPKKKITKLYGYEYPE
ncbi:peptidylprolyl isomerase [Reichenbachiella carrageenanivorans]|uniref:Peptidyl-prolyl cis-trans isomerase n=1 Tax=Reichenbachiella carrageenanivorans TaxID=2979869 RepID=A0ABY6D2A6_9BACT|nr:peptidylprolyl isomerase [Reichenbachiella carrageenanivorans]UXX80294.1 peptidylprolyl isomerase [Reichenbachiella carrageenanivorans]